MSRPPGVTVAGNDWRAALVEAERRPPGPVSVVVVHYEQHEQLARTLHALARQTHPPELLEVVVVDDGSTRAPDVPDGVRLVRRPDLGFTAAAARNDGARAASHPVLLFLDADTTPEPAYVERLAALPAHVGEAVVVGRRRHADLSGTDLEAPVEELGPAHELAEPAWLADGLRVSEDLLRADEGSYRYLISSVLGCSRWLHEQLGGFDESFDAYGGEDWEWAWRAWELGAVLAHRPGAVAWHDGPDWAERGGGSTAKAAESLRLARRTAAPGAGLHGLLVGPPELAVSVADELSDPHALIALDSLLRARPNAAVDARPALVAGDPRVGRTGPAPYAVRLRAGVVGPPEAWAALLDLARGPDAPHTVTVLDEHGPLVEVRVQRAHRRMQRWGRDDLFEARSATAEQVGLRRLGPGATLEAHAGGWL